jgi:enoyl-CoA hydratase/carnithine racemase
VSCAVRGGIAWVRLERAATGNRLDADVMTGLIEAADVVEERDDVHVVVLSAAGRDFCRGLPHGCHWPAPAWPDGVGAIGRITRPVVAAVSGEAHGWGLALALACDIRLLARRAVLVVPSPDAGLPGGGLGARLARIVGPARAAELLLLGGRVPAPRAVEWGLARAVVAETRLIRAAETLATGLAERGPLALRCAKEAVVRALDLPLDDGLRLEHDLYVLLQTTGDRGEGVRAFLERRRPHFHGH